jgi:hypothetical protein
MTEAEWLACDDPWKLLEEIGWIASERKLRLFAVACCRSLWHVAGDDLTRETIDAAERFADGTITEEEAIEAASFMVQQLPVTFTDHLSDDQANLLFSAGRMCLSFDLIDNVQAVLGNLKWRDKENAAVLRDVIGNPYRHLVVRRTWRTNTVKQLARAIYDDRAFENMPILGDALEEVGCADPAFLKHCRSTEPHVRGCWLIDKLLQKK